MDTFYVRNEDSFPLGQPPTVNPGAYLVPARLNSENGQGTMMTMVAAGKMIGVAPNADLFLLKVKGHWNRQATSNIKGIGG